MTLHGGNVYDFNKSIIDFSSNINPLGTPKCVKEAIIKSADFAHIYPDTKCRDLKCALGAKYGLPKQYFICGNGGAELIYTAVQAIQPKRALFCAPTFSEYEQAADTVGAEKIFYYLKDDFIIGKDFLDLIDNINMVFICNPNNPTGLCCDFVSEIAKICGEKNIYLFLDECFLDFVENGSDLSLASYVGENENVFILKSLTKMYAMAGVRLGFGICSNQKLLQKMESVKQPWAVSVTAQMAGVSALSAEIEVETVKFICTEREFLLAELRKLGYTCFDSKANYIFLRSDKNLYEPLINRYGILIRDCSNYKGLEGGTYYRIAIKTHNENIKLIKALMEIEQLWQSR